MSENTLDELNIELLRNKLYKVIVLPDVFFLITQYNILEFFIIKVTLPIAQLLQLWSMYIWNIVFIVWGHFSYMHACQFLLSFALCTMPEMQNVLFRWW